MQKMHQKEQRAKEKLKQNLVFVKVINVTKLAVIDNEFQYKNNEFNTQNMNGNNVIFSINDNSI